MGKGNHKTHHQPAENRGDKPAERCKFEVPRVQTVRIESTTEDNEWKAEQRRNWKKQFRTSTTLNVITIVTAIIAFAYGFVTFLQWKDAHYNFRLDQRAWMGFNDMKADWGKGDFLRITVTLLNSGKTPAQDVTSYTAFSVMRPPDTLNDRDILWTTGSSDLLA